MFFLSAAIEDCIVPTKKSRDACVVSPCRGGRDTRINVDFVGVNIRICKSLDECPRTASDCVALANRVSKRNI